MAMAQDKETPVDPLTKLLQENARLEVRLQVEKVVSQEHWDYYSFASTRAGQLERALRRITEMDLHYADAGDMQTIARDAINAK